MSGAAPVPEHVKRDQILVYFLAAPEDEEACRAVDEFLSPIIRNSKIPIIICSDYSIPPGENIDSYKEKLYEAILDFQKRERRFGKTSQQINQEI